MPPKYPVNMTPEKSPMPCQEPHIRNKNFDEVARGYTAETAIAEARRCLQCPTKPCVAGCPVSIDIPAFIAEMAEGRFEEAYQIIHRSSSLPAVKRDSLGKITLVMDSTNTPAMMR